MKSLAEWNKKGQLSLSDAPTIVLLVGLVFLVMATIAFVSSKYGTAIGSTVSVSVENENVTVPGTIGNATLCNFGSFSVSSATNVSGDATTDFTADASAGTITNTTSDSGVWTLNYTHSWGGTACEVTGDLETEIGNNTSIAGIVLTISLVGIVLTVLIGIFLVARAPGRS